MKKLRLFGLSILGAVALVGLVYGVAYLVASSGKPEATSPVPIASDDGSATAEQSSRGPDADTQIAFWQKRIAANGRGYIDLTFLGEAYARKARETGDVSFYEQAQRALQKALEVNPKYVPSSELLSSVLLSVHDFRGALSLAKPLAKYPKAIQALATLGDAQLALGNYREAEAAFNELLDRAPVPSAYSRLAFLADLRGDPDEALALMDRAARLAEESGEYGESLAWYAFQVGELAFKVGRLDLAESHYRAALRVFDRYYLALGGLAKVNAARGDYETAIDLYRRATEIVPQPELLAALGDVYAARNEKREAKEQYDTVEFIGKLAKVNRQVYNRQLANFYSDHDLRVAEGLRLALAELAVRKDVFGYDAAAWAYYKNGVLDRAQVMIERALRLGTRDARLYYHAGMIAKAQGRAAEARGLLSEALEINPHFDLLQAPIAQAALDELA